ncbi:histone-lysine N-methyltransferase ATXR4 [Euphorbia lathyris]|uniref:histone-lysine N-methyltransferase ATXR4 n=1 Tax=Euphorbia lathyris TaxID=212925 RepID=UPI0033133871
MSALLRYSRWVSRFQNTQLVAFFSSENEKGPPPIRVGITELAGRGVFATRRIGAGELIHTAKPFVSHPSLSSVNTVCYFCLKKLSSTEFENHNVGFCSQECKENAKVFYDVETKADWSVFNDYCRNRGLKYPLIVKRLACTVISGAASAQSLDILQPASLSPRMILEMEQGFDLLRSGFSMTNIPQECMAFLNKEWYCNVMARIRINAFRIELALGSYEHLLSSAAACIEAEAAVGNAIYMLPSFYNHDCDPNTHIIWIDNADARLKALRDIETDEELRICYIDASMDHDARQNILLHGFGFKCRCPRCLSGD